jgi:hypothetical protein
MLPEVSRGELEGVVLAEYRVTEAGSVAEVRFPYPDSPARLEVAVEEWLRTCTAPVVAVGWHRLGFGFLVPYTRDEGYPSPPDWRKPLKELEGYRPPKLLRCAPDEPTFLDDVDASQIDVVVGRDGRISALRSVLRDDPGYLLPTVDFWVQTCRFSPARDPSGQAVAANVPLSLLGQLHDPAPGVALPPPDWVRDLKPPKPDPACGKPVPTEKLRLLRLTGLVLVEFVVHSDGHVGEVRLRNPAHLALFHLVRSWLLACPYTPSKKSTGEPVPVKILQPFTFKASY